MSLKAFHLVFIVSAILLTVSLAIWSWLNYFSPQGVKSDLLGGIGCSLAAVGLVCYEIYFLKKFKKVSYL